MKYDSLGEFISELDNYYGGWDTYVQKFLRMPEQNRLVELVAFDELLREETKITRDHAEYRVKRKELGDHHDLLHRAGR